MRIDQLYQQCGDRISGAAAGHNDPGKQLAGIGLRRDWRRDWQRESPGPSVSLSWTISRSEVYAPSGRSEVYASSGVSAAGIYSAAELSALATGLHVSAPGKIA